MTAPAHLRGDMRNAPIPLRVERHRWVTQQRRTGASWSDIGKMLGISKTAAYAIDLQCDPTPRPPRYEVSFRKADGTTGKHVIAAHTREAAEVRAVRPYSGAVVVGAKILGDEE